MSVKLYPPVISGVLPAFYLEYDSATGTILKGGSLTIPFTNNASVGESQVKGLSLRLRTASSGSYVLPPIFSNTYSYAQGEVTFELTAKQASLLNEGQYYKIQIAYCATQIIDEAGNVDGTDIGYYSTVGVAKCTSKPTVTIRGLEFENINAFNNEMFGLYDLSLCKDRTEKVYSYEFKVYDEEENVYYTTGEKLHQSYYDTDYLSSLDRVILNDFASTDTIYSIEYNVTTINGLQLSSPKYRISSQYLVSPNEEIEIKPEADQEHGTITIHFLGHTDPARSFYFVVNKELLNNLEVDDEGQPLKDRAGYTLLDKVIDGTQNIRTEDKLAYLRNNSIYKHWRFDAKTWYYTFGPNRFPYKTLIRNKYYDNDDVEGYSEEELSDAYLNQLDSYELIISGKNLLKQLTYEYVKENYINLAKEIVVGEDEREKRYYGSYLLSRASDEDNYTTWFNIARFRLDDQMPSEFSIQDVTIEHGRKYKYALQQYNIWGLYSARTISDIFEASFEDAFLYDGEKVLRIRYNPTVDSFKTTLLEQKTDTIGGKFPFITRNGATYYKEFPLGGLLAQEIDDQYSFIDPEYGIVHRHATGEDDRKAPKYAYRDYHMFSDANIALERDFKLKVLEWLNNGKPKLFKSPYEGNYIVRLMNNSLSPVKELGRMLHSFTSTAYEIADCTYENLVAYGFIKVAMPSDFIGLWRSYNLDDDSLKNDDEEIIIHLENGIKTFTVQDMMPGDIIYLTFSDEDKELPIMIGITGSYTYESTDKTLVKIRVPAAEDHRITGIINCFYEGMRITDFDSIISTQLKTMISQQYIGVSPWMESLKYNPYIPSQTVDGYQDPLLPDYYNELQNYNMRTYLSKFLTLRQGNNGSIYYTINTKKQLNSKINFVTLAQSFDPGELLDRINLSINQDKKFKTELMKMEMMRFRLRPVIPVYTHQRWNNSNLYIPGSFESLLKENIMEQNDEIFMVSTSPYGYPHPMDELAEYEMIDPFCIYKVLEWQADLDDWIPVRGKDYPYYDPYYRTWLGSDYDPRVKMDYEWKQVVLLERYTDEQLFVDKEFDDALEVINQIIMLKDDSDEFAELNNDARLSHLKDDQDYLRLQPDSRRIYRENIINQSNKNRLANGEYIEKAIDEEKMYDYELLNYKHVEDNKEYYYYYYIDNKKETQMIDSIKYDLYKKYGDQYYVTGENIIRVNEPYWVKQYKIKINLSTEKVVEYKDIAPMNSYHIGNGVVAELTFQLRVVDYYTEIYDDDVRAAKEEYINAKQFYIQLMKLYNNIVKSNLNMRVNSAFEKLYDRLINGTSERKGNLSDSEIAIIESALKSPVKKADLKLMSLYNITSINSALNNEILELLLDYKKRYFQLSYSDNEDDVAYFRYTFERAELYYYYEEMMTKVIDEYYLLNKDEDFLPMIEVPDKKPDSMTNDEYNKLKDLRDNNDILYLERQRATKWKEINDKLKTLDGEENKKEYYKRMRELGGIELYEDAGEEYYNQLVNNIITDLREENLELSDDDINEVNRLIAEIEECQQVIETLEVAEEKIHAYRMSIGGKEYFFKVNKQKYIDELDDTAFVGISRDELVVYPILENGVIVDFQVEDKMVVSENIGIIYELVKQDNTLITTQIALLDDEELAALKIEDYYLYSDLVLDNNESKAIINGKEVSFGHLLYEETEINTVLNTQTIEGTNQKLQVISSEINKINEDIISKQNTLDAFILDYITSYSNMLNDIDAYNEDVYNDWCARVIKEYLTIDFDNNKSARLLGYVSDQQLKNSNLTVENKEGLYVAVDSSGQIYQFKISDGQENQFKTILNNQSEPFSNCYIVYEISNNYRTLKNAINKFISDNSSSSINILVTTLDKFNAYELASNNLYEAIAGDLPSVQLYITTQNDNIQDELWDTYSEEQTSILKGRIILQFLALYEALRGMANIINAENSSDNEDKDIKMINDFIEKFNNVLKKYNVLYDQLIDLEDEDHKFIQDFLVNSVGETPIQDFINDTYNSYIELLTQENINYIDENYFDLKNIALLSNYHNDINFLYKDTTIDGYNDIIVKISEQDNDNLILRKFYWKLSAKYDTQEGSHSNFFDPLRDRNRYNFFLKPLNNSMTDDLEQTLLSNSYKNISTYWYRTGGINDMRISIKPVEEELEEEDEDTKEFTNWFIFTPTSSKVKDSHISNEYTSNQMYLQAQTIGAQQKIITLYELLINKILIILDSVIGTNTNSNNAIIKALEDTYIRDLRFERYKILNNYITPDGEDASGSVRIMQEKILRAQNALLDEPPVKFIKLYDLDEEQEKNYNDYIQVLFNTADNNKSIETYKQIWNELVEYRNNNTIAYEKVIPDYCDNYYHIPYFNSIIDGPFKNAADKYYYRVYRSKDSFTENYLDNYFYSVFIPSDSTKVLITTDRSGQNNFDLTNLIMKDENDEYKNFYDGTQFNTDTMIEWFTNGKREYYLKKNNNKYELIQQKAQLDNIFSNNGNTSIPIYVIDFVEYDWDNFSLKTDALSGYYYKKGKKYEQITIKNYRSITGSIYTKKSEEKVNYVLYSGTISPAKCSAFYYKDGSKYVQLKETDFPEESINMTGNGSRQNGQYSSSVNTSTSGGSFMPHNNAAVSLVARKSIKVTDKKSKNYKNRLYYTKHVDPATYEEIADKDIFLGNEEWIKYYCDFDDSEYTDPELITKDNIDKIRKHKIYCIPVSVHDQISASGKGDGKIAVFEETTYVEYGYQGLFYDESNSNQFYQLSKKNVYQNPNHQVNSYTNGKFNFDKNTEINMPKYKIYKLEGNYYHSDPPPIDVYDLPFDECWNQPIIIKEDILKEITEVIFSGIEASLAEDGLYYKYLDNFYIAEIIRLTQLLNEAQTLQRLYQKQLDNYSDKYDTYATEAELNQAIYNSYMGTEAFEYYNLLNKEGVTEAEKQEVIQKYKRTVQEAWWKFISLLDERYTAEKERGMYV